MEKDVANRKEDYAYNEIFPDCYNPLPNRVMDNKLYHVAHYLYKRIEGFSLE